jgi:hypothetical protein
MYDFYPEWGPARHREQDEAQPPMRRMRYWRGGTAPAMATAGGADPRDAAWERPDDN